MIDTHAEMALDYGIDVTVAASESVKFDMMGSVFLYMGLCTKPRSSRDNRTVRDSGRGREGDSPRDWHTIEAKNSTA